MNKIKGLLLQFVKPLVLAHIKDLGLLAPLFANVLVSKAKLSQDMATALASDLVAVAEGELAALINKL